MLFFTHIELAKAIYQEVFAEYDTVIERHSFIYGNIRSDLMFVGEKMPHTSACTLNKVKAKAQMIMSEEISDKERSILYGEICHFVCDYFCLYHADERKYNKHVKHFFYEVVQYLKFSLTRLSGHNIFNDLFNPQEKMLSGKLFCKQFYPDQIERVILANQQDYLISREDLKTAYLNACSICSYILSETSLREFRDTETIPVIYSSAV